MLKNAFNALVNLQGKNRQVVLYASASSYPATPTTYPAAPSNYFRQPVEVGSVVGKGRQFVMIAEHVHAALGRPPKRGDRLDDISVYGKCSIDNVEEMHDLGGAVIGYRIYLEG